MLVPAILYKDEIHKNMQKYFYTEDMLLETGCMGNWCPEISDCPNDGNIQYAIVDNNGKLIGILFYWIDWYADSVSRFGLFSFDRGNPVIGKDLFEELERLIKRHRRIEWRMVGGNPVEKHYDKFCFKYNGKKHVLKDGIRDRDGSYRDDVIYEILKERERK